MGPMRFLFSCLTVASMASVAAAQETPAEDVDSKRVVLFPLEAVNVSEGTAEATALLLRSALVDRGYDVAPLADVKEALGEMRRGHQEKETTPPNSSTAVADEQTDADQEVLDNAAPGASTQAEAQPAATLEPPHEAALTLDKKGAVAKRLGAFEYLDASLVALGSRYRLEVTWRRTDGTSLASKNMVAKTEDDLNTVIPRIVEALVTSKKTEETRTLDNASLAETDNLPNRFRLEKNFGPVVGMLTGFEEAGTGPVIGFNARLEVEDFLIDLIAMMGFPSVKDAGGDSTQGFLLEACVGAGGYLTHTQVAPYLIGGLGVWVGDRFGAAKTTDEDGYDYYDDEASVGGDLFGAFGIEFLRHTRIRLHLDVRYVFTFTGDGQVGHSLLPMVGLNF